MKKRLRYIAILLIFVSIAGYTYYQTRGLSRGPILSIDYPSDGMTLNEQGIFVRGIVKNASYVTMNGRQIFVDEENKFKERVLLSLGYNIIEIEVKDRFERVKTEKLEIIYKPNVSF